jgi:2-polyprenyl-6-methoxyphenol hydroxylase-like FAD-dependent oxidoreductase
MKERAMPSTNPLLPHDHYDVLVVGARVAGASTAMLLARAGRRVALVDRAARGSDTLSSHALMRGAVIQLERWGLLDRVIAAGTPVIRTTTFHYGSDIVPIPIQPEPGIDGLYAPRRTVLDPIVADAAGEAGADVRFETQVVALSKDGAGRVVGAEVREPSGDIRRIHADLVVGADGAESSVARAVGAPVTRQGIEAGSNALAYIEGLEPDGYHWGFGEGAGAGFIPTNDGLTCVFVGVPHHRFVAEVKPDVQGSFLPLLAEVSPVLAARAAAGRQASRVRAFAGRPGFFRRPHGPGWALVGDAGHWKDPYAAHGITDALRDAELLTDAILDGELARYERERDAIALPLFETLEEIASYRWDLARLRQLHLALSDEMNEQIATMRSRSPLVAG